MQDMSYGNEFGQKKRSTTEDQLISEWRKDLSQVGKTSLSERTFYKDLNFDTIKHFQAKLIENYNALHRLLQVIAKNTNEHKELVKMRFVVFKRMGAMIDRLTFDWLEATASFSGSSELRQEAYETIVDELKAAVSGCSPPTDKDQLEMFLITFKHYAVWLLGESLVYSLGERVDATDPQRYGLQQSQIQAAAGLDAMNKGQQISRNALDRGGRGGKSFKRIKPRPPQESSEAQGSD